MAAAAVKFYFRFRLGDVTLLRVNIYQQSKFRRDDSIHVCNITISGLENRTSAILDFYFRFQFRPHHRNQHTILYKDTKFRSNRAIHGGVMMLEPIFKMAAATAQFYVRFPIR